MVNYRVRIIKTFLILILFGSVFLYLFFNTNSNRNYPKEAIAPDFGIHKFSRLVTPSPDPHDYFPFDLGLIKVTLEGGKNNKVVMMEPRIWFDSKNTKAKEELVQKKEILIKKTIALIKKENPENLVKSNKKGNESFVIKLNIEFSKVLEFNSFRKMDFPVFEIN